MTIQVIHLLSFFFGVILSANLLHLRASEFLSDLPLVEYDRDSGQGQFGSRVISYAVLDIPSYGEPGSPQNVIIDVDAATELGLPPGTQLAMTGVGWDVFLESVSVCVTRLIVGFGPDDDNKVINLRPGAGSCESGTFGIDGIIQFSDIPLPVIVMPNGVLQLEFFTEGSTAPDDIDGWWRSGELRLQFAVDCSVPPHVCLGDVNCDGAISVSDIEPFILVLTALGEYAIQYPTCDPLNGDLNGDGALTVSDISGFVTVVTSS